MTDKTRRERDARESEQERRDAERRTEESRTRLKDRLYKAKASGQMDEDDEALIRAYAQGVVSRRGGGSD